MVNPQQHPRPNINAYWSSANSLYIKHYWEQSVEKGGKNGRETWCKTKVCIIMSKGAVIIYGRGGPNFSKRDTALNFRPPSIQQLIKFCPPPMQCACKILIIFQWLQKKRPINLPWTMKTGPLIKRWYKILPPPLPHLMGQQNLGPPPIFLGPPFHKWPFPKLSNIFRTFSLL